MIVQHELVNERQELLVLVSSRHFAHDKIMVDALIELLEVCLHEEASVVQTQCFLHSLDSERQSFVLDARTAVRDQRSSDVFLDDAHDRMIKNVPREIVCKYDVASLAAVNDAFRDAIVWIWESKRQDHLTQFQKLLLALAVELTDEEVARRFAAFLTFIRCLSQIIHVCDLLDDISLPFRHSSFCSFCC